MSELELTDLIELICSDPPFMSFEEVCFILKAHHYCQERRSSNNNIIFRHKSTGKKFIVTCTDDQKIKRTVLKRLKDQLELECENYENSKN